MKKIFRISLASTVALALAVSFGTVVQAAGETANPGTSVLLQQKVVSPARGFAGKPVKGGTGTGITYHGGPVMTNPIVIYPIWYGNFSTGVTGTKDILTSFMSNIGGSPRFNINTTYFNGSNLKVQNSVSLSSSQVTDTTYKYGKNLSDANIASIVTDALNASALPRDPNGFYLVLTDGTVAESSGFLTKYCGWHTYLNHTVNRVSVSIKYSFVGDPTNGLGSCAAQTTSPNNNAAADGMVSVITHELEEAATDPQLNAWYDAQGNENSDKCAWKFGTTSTATNGSLYNLTIGGKQYLVQQNWVNAGTGGCLNSY